MFTDKDFKDSKAIVFKIFTISIVSELIREHLVQEQREFYTEQWFYTACINIIGFLVFQLGTAKIAKTIADGEIITSIFDFFNLTERKRNFWKTVIMDGTKYLTHGTIKGYGMMLLLGKEKTHGILMSIIAGTMGTVLFELLFSDFYASAKEIEVLEGTLFYKHFQLYSRAIKATIKTAIALLGSDIVADGDIDTDQLISFLITLLALPFFFLVIEPKVMCGHI